MSLFQFIRDFKRLCIYLAVFVSVLFCIMPISAFAGDDNSPPYAHIVFDAGTGKILSQDDADRSLYPASLTKLMTLLMTFDALKSRKITLRSSVLMSSHAASMPPSKIGVKVGKTISVDNAVKALVTKSANDVAVALGEKLGGSEKRFAQLMTQRARQIGMTQTHFANASGLHNVRQVSSARDMGKLALYILKTYPHYYDYFGLKNFYYNGKMYTNHNRLMSSYRGMDGMKTGYIRQSGFNLVASARRGNTRLVGVVFGGKSAISRNERMADLLDAGFGRRGLVPDDRTQNYGGSYNTRYSNYDKPILTLPAPSKPPKPFATPNNNTVTYLKKPTYGSDQQNAVPLASLSQGWSIQIGAYGDRVTTDQAIYRAIKNLPAPLNRGKPVIIPLRTANQTWVFRARITGYTREQATQACRYLDDCLTLSPSAN